MLRGQQKKQITCEKYKAYKYIWNFHPLIHTKFTYQIISILVKNFNIIQNIIKIDDDDKMI